MSRARSIHLLANATLAGAMAAAVLCSCSQPAGTGTVEQTASQAVANRKQTATAQCNLNEPTAGESLPPCPAGVEPVHTKELHNVFWIGKKLVSGAAPENAAGFDELAALGIKTVLSVDGSTPDVQAAWTRGMRYVHIPITYAEVTRAQQLEIARAVRDLPGPIYIHCHHGKHRGPAAAATTMVLLGELSGEQGVAFMKHAGTAKNYSGLYACVAAAVIATPAELDATPAEFVAVRPPAGITASMVSVDVAYDNLGLIRAAGWKVPGDHPDLVPAAEAGQLADHLRFSGEDARAKAWGVRFEELLRRAIGEATALEGGLADGRGEKELEALWTPMVASCKECHAAFRDHAGHSQEKVMPSQPGRQR